MKSGCFDHNVLQIPWDILNYLTGVNWGRVGKKAVETKKLAWDFISHPFCKNLENTKFHFSGLFFKTAFITFLKNSAVYNFYYKGSTARYVYESKWKFFLGSTGVCVKNGVVLHTRVIRHVCMYIHTYICNICIRICIDVIYKMGESWK